MKSALIALAALVPALAFADDPAPYVVHEGRAVARSQPAPAAQGASSAKQPSSFGTGAVRTQISDGRSGAVSSSASEAAVQGAPAKAASGSRRFRSSRRSGRRGIIGTPPAGGAGGSTPAPAPAADAPPPYAVPGAKILTAGQQPVYSDPGNGGTHSVEGGGFIDIDQAKAHDVGRAPGIAWAPPDTPPSAGKSSGGGGGTGASSNGPSTTSSPTGAPAVAPTTNQANPGATGFDGSF